MFYEYSFGGINSRFAGGCLLRYAVNIRCTAVELLIDSTTVLHRSSFLPWLSAGRPAYVASCYATGSTMVLLVLIELYFDIIALLRLVVTCVRGGKSRPVHWEFGDYSKYVFRLRHV